MAVSTCFCLSGGSRDLWLNDVSGRSGCDFGVNRLFSDDTFESKSNILSFLLSLCDLTNSEESFFFLPFLHRRVRFVALTAAMSITTNSLSDIRNDSINLAQLSLMDRWWVFGNCWDLKIAALLLLYVPFPLPAFSLSCLWLQPDLTVCHTVLVPFQNS